MDNYEDESDLGYEHSNNPIPERLRNLSKGGYNGHYNRPHNSRPMNRPKQNRNSSTQQVNSNNKDDQQPSKPTTDKSSGNNNNNNVQNNKPNQPQKSPNGDVGERNLKKSLASKARNFIGRGKRKNKKNSDSNNKESSNSSPSVSDNNQSDSGSDSSTGGLEAKLLRRIKTKIIIYSIIIMFSLLFFFAFLFAVFGVDITQTLPAIAPSSYESSDFQALNEKGTEAYENEINYYKKIKEIEKKNSELKSSYIHAFLIYRYYVDESLNEENIINFKDMTEHVDTITSIISSKSNDDYKINGEIYNAIKESDEFKSYYNNVLKDEDPDKLLSAIFDLASELDEVELVDETVISSETKVTVNKTSTETSTKSTTTSSKSMTINDYIADSIYATTDNYSNSELVKAYTITYSTNIVSENKKLSISSNSALTTGNTCSVKNGCSYDDNGNLVDGKGERNSQNTVYYNGGYYYKAPLSSDEVKTMNSSINSVFGNVLVNSDGTYPTLDTSILAGFGDGDYKSVLKSTYGDLKYKNVGENSYILDGNYGTKKVLTPVLFYDQKDYPKDSFCGLKKSTIGGSGCGVTAMAIVASTYENTRKFDPIYMNKEARSKGACSSSGTAQNFFQKEARTLGYKYMGGTKFNKSLLNSVLKHLQEGHLVVVRMLSGHFTNGGHYMVLGGVDPETKKVYVYDPNNRSNRQWRKTGNGWYSFNDIIVKEAYNFYIIWKG